jgi:hypothetical protein
MHVQMDKLYRGRERQQEIKLASLDMDWTAGYTSDTKIAIG